MLLRHVILYRVLPIGSSARGASTLGGSGGMLPREFLKFSFSKMHILHILREIQRKYGENCMCLAANWYLFQYSNGNIQIIGFQTVTCMQLVYFLSPTKYQQLPMRVSLSQIRRLNAAVAICRRYRLSEDIALLMYIALLKLSDRFQYDKRWKQI